MRLLLVSGALAPLFLPACNGDEACPPGSHRQDDGLCHLDEDPDAADGGSEADGGAEGDGGNSDGGSAGDGGSDEGPPDLALGDPISTLGTATGGFYEHVDAEVIDEQWAILVGQGGFSIASLDDGHIDGQYAGERGYYLGVHGGTAWVGTKYNGLYEVDLSDPQAPVLGRRVAPLPTGEAHHDLDFDGSLVAVSWLDQGVQLLDHETLVEVGRVEAEEARGLALADGRLLYCDEVDDQAWLVLVDLSDPSAPVEQDRAPLSARGHDVSVQGDRVAVAMGGSGAAVFEIEEGVLVARGEVDLPGTTMGVALDGDHLWTGSWEVAGLVWVGEGATPTVLGHEAVTESAMGIAAADGRAMVADWFYTTALQAHDGVGGAELVVADALYVDAEAEGAERLEVWNNGLFDLDVAIAVSEGGYTVEPDSFTLAPGLRRTVLVERTGGDPNGRLRLSTNDPDETEVDVDIRASANGVGQPHVDFELQGFSWPDGALSNHRLSDFEGEVVFLAYWAEF